MLPLLLMICLAAAAQTDPAGKMSYWSQQRKGANCANRDVEPEYWQAAAEVGIEFIRLAPDSWRTTERDFLIGSADSFTTIVEDDFVTLERVLADAHAQGVRVVLTMFSLPGARWVQLNENVQDDRLWRDFAYHEQAAEFWRQLAARLKDNPAVVAYNPLNEPHPSRTLRKRGVEFDEWVESAKGTPADVNAFNARIVDAIREVDPATPIILDGWDYATPEAIRFVEPVADERTLYAMHAYEWLYTTFRVNNGRFAYPDKMPLGDGRMTKAWTPDSFRAWFAPAAHWVVARGLPRNRVIVSEFGCDRRVEGAKDYLADLISALNQAGVHWAFYAFRDDGDWGGLDYELGTEKLGWDYWKAVEAGEDPELYKYRHNNPLWEVIRREFTAGEN